MNWIKDKLDSTGWTKFYGLCGVGVLLILSGVGLVYQQGSASLLSTAVFLGAAALFLLAIPLLHFTFSQPLNSLRRELDLFSNTWLSKEPAKACGISDVATGLREVHQEVDQATLRVKELEATLNVFSIEKEQMEAVLKSLPIAVLVTNRYNELLLSNDVAERLFTFEGEDSRNQAIEDVLAWKPLVNLIRETSNRKVKVPRRRVELTYQVEDRDSRVLLIILSSITDHANQILGVVTIVQDATKEREIDRMKSEFVANVSHELKTPLSSIKAYTEMLIDGEASDEKSQKEFCAIIESEANRLSSMIDNLLDLSRLEAGVVQMKMDRVNLITMLKSLEDTIRPNAEKKGITLESDISQYIMPVRGDEGQLTRVFMNLLSNAIKYTGEGGNVSVMARLEGDLIRVDVSDSGYGIPEDALPKIFEKFYRVKENMEFAHGTGMGLAMVKRILEMHNADIKVKSEAGEGSCFSVFIPSAD